MLTGLYAFSQRSLKNKRSLRLTGGLTQITDKSCGIYHTTRKSSPLCDAIWAFEYQTKHENDDCFPSNNSHREQPCYEKLHCLFSFNHFNFDLDPKSFINHCRWPSMLQSSSNGLHLALGMWDPLNCNLAETYFSKQGKVPVISFIEASKSLGFTQRLMSGKINTSFTVPADTPWP